MYTKKQKIKIYIAFLGIIYSIEILTAIFILKDAISLYLTSNLPKWMLRIRYLAPIWMVLHTFVGIAGAKIWMTPLSLIRSHTLYAFTISMLLDFLYPITFFYVPMPILSPFLNTLLFISFLALIFYAFLMNKTASFLLIPYVFWIFYKMIFHWLYFILNI